MHPEKKWPGSIRAVLPAPLGGRIVMSGFPGLVPGLGGAPSFDDAQCRETLDGLIAEGARRVMVLVERDELAEVGMQLLRDASMAAGLALIHRPIVDYCVPGAAFMATWDAERTARLAAFRAGETFAVHCRHGAGRSGLVAALCLIEQGMAPDAAIAQIRSVFDEAVETPEQEAFLRARAA